MAKARIIYFDRRAERRRRIVAASILAAAALGAWLSQRGESNGTGPAVAPSSSQAAKAVPDIARDPFGARDWPGDAFQATEAGDPH